MKKFIITMLVAASLIGSSQVLFANESDPVIATVGTDEIRESDYIAVLEKLPPYQRAYLNSEEGRETMLVEVATAYILAQVARDHKFDETQEYKTRMARASREALFEIAVRELLMSLKVEDEDYRAYYDANPDKFISPESVKASHILFTIDSKATPEAVAEMEKKALEVMKEINDGKITFEDAAKSYSSCPSRTKGGDLGFFTKGQMVKEFEDAAFALENGQMSKEPVRSQFGYHIIMRVDSKEESKIAFEDIDRGAIKDDVLNFKRKETYANIVKEGKEKYPIVILGKETE